MYRAKHLGLFQQYETDYKYSRRIRKTDVQCCAGSAQRMRNGALAIQARQAAAAGLATPRSRRRRQLASSLAQAAQQRLHLEHILCVCGAALHELCQ